MFVGVNSVFLPSRLGCLQGWGESELVQLLIFEYILKEIRMSNNGIRNLNSSDRGAADRGLHMKVEEFRKMKSNVNYLDCNGKNVLNNLMKLRELPFVMRSGCGHKNEGRMGNTNCIEVLISKFKIKV